MTIKIRKSRKTTRKMKSTKGRTTRKIKTTPKTCKTTKYIIQDNHLPEKKKENSTHILRENEKWTEIIKILKRKNQEDNEHRGRY